MFCRQCGKELPDGVAYCSRCGIEQRLPAIVVKPDEVANYPRSAIQPLKTAAAVGAFIIVVFMLMPWIGVPALRTMGQYASSVGITALSGDYTYPLWGLYDVVKALKSILPASQYSMVVSIWIIFLVGWAGSLVALVVGAVRALTGKKSPEFLFGACVAVIIVTIAWAVAIAGMNGAIAGEVSRYTSGYVSSVKMFETPMAVYLTIACSLVVAVLSRMARDK